MKDLEQRLNAQVEGEVYGDLFNRGRYATDASKYQVFAVGVVVPKTIEDVRNAMAFAHSEGIPVLPRGGGSSQCGQTVDNALVIDHSKNLNRIIKLDVEIV